jgi:hypothetical protein
MRAWRYHIVVEGELDQVSASRFEDVTIECDDGCTLLHTGEIDQATLHGLLDRLRHIAAPLVAVTREPHHRGSPAIPHPG